MTDSPSDHHLRSTASKRWWAKWASRRPVAAQSASPGDELPPTNSASENFKWPSWLTAPVVISTFALLVAGGNAYLTLIDHRDDIQAFWSKHPQVRFVKESASDTSVVTTQFRGNFEVTFFNLGNRVAIIREATATFLYGRDEADCSLSAEVATLSFDSPTIILKPGEAQTAVFIANEKSRGIKLEKGGGSGAITTTMNSRANFTALACLDFSILTPNGPAHRTFKIDQWDFFPTDDSRSTPFMNAMPSAPVTLYHARGPLL